MNHIGVEFYPQPVVAFSTMDALIAELDAGQPLQDVLHWENARILVSEIGPNLYVLIAATPGRCNVPVTFAKLALWECSCTGYDELTRRVWLASDWTRRIALKIPDDDEFWKLV